MDQNKRIIQAHPVMLLVAAAIVLFGETLFAGKTYFIRDLTFLFHPWRVFSAENIQSGIFPVWNHYSACGMPFLANLQSAVLYPFSLFFYLFNFVIALKLYYLAHIFLAGLFAYLFSRKKGLTRWQSIVPALVFCLNGYMLTRLEFLSHIGSDIWLFAMFLFINNPVLLSLSFVMSFTAGHQMFFNLLLIVLLYALFNPDRDIIKTRITNLSSAVFMCAGIAACQLLPTIELVSLSDRLKSGISDSVAMLNSMNISEIGGFLSPYFTVRTAAVTLGEKFNWLNGFYVGFVTVIFLILRNLKIKISKNNALAVTLIFLGLVLALGDNTPVYPFLYKYLPFFRLMRYPVQFLFVSITGIFLLMVAAAKNFKYASIAAILIAIELLSVSWKFQPTASDSYFSHKPALASFLQNSESSRFLLSPGTETDRHFNEKNISDAWQESREFLYGLTALPYKVFNAYGIGEPFVPYSAYKLIDIAYGKRNPQDAIQIYKILGARYLVCKNKLINDKGYILIYPNNPKVYSIVDGKGIFLPAKDTKLGRIYFYGNKIETESFSKKGSEIIVRENFFPGWKVYVNGGIVPSLKNADGFRFFKVPPGYGRINLVYTSKAVFWGIVFSAIFVILLILTASKAVLRQKEVLRKYE